MNVKNVEKQYMLPVCTLGWDLSCSAPFLHVHMTQNFILFYKKIFAWIIASLIELNEICHTSYFLVGPIWTTRQDNYAVIISINVTHSYEWRLSSIIIYFIGKKLWINKVMSQPWLLRECCTQHIRYTQSWIPFQNIYT